ncbi:MAG: NAD-dependent DNA ligase LigA [Candidatus Heimdallarchaeota archaeon]|nr:NAD-dependent DNA ligase LigA [Candidatus Heimdallarchaeota archaeon]
MSEEEIKQLENLILYHKRKYYDGEPEISDVEYDSIEDKLRGINPNNPVLFIVGTSSGGSISHDPPMLSCKKAKTVEEIISWAKNRPLMTGYKIDGLSLKLVYQDTKLIQAATRGSGIKGDDVTLNILKIQAIPKTVPFEKRVEIRGELYMRISEFNRINDVLADDEKYSNPRNLAAGTAKQKDARMMDERTLNFMAFEILGWNDNATIDEKASVLKSWQFETSDILKLSTPDFEEISTVFNKIESERDSLDFEIDGLVFKYNLAADREAVGATDHHSRWQIALKFESKGKSTKLNAITWQVGRTSVLTPVAELEPVEVSGAVISRASMHNADFLINLGAKPGDFVYVERSGEVIPKIISVTAKNSTGEVILPDQCPSCGAKTVKSGVNLLCTGDSCRGKDIQQISSWIRKTVIDGIGSQSLEKLYDSGLVKHYSDLYALTEDQLVKLLGKNGSKILTSINGTRDLPFRTFLAGLGIEKLGTTMGKKLAQSFSSLDELKEASMDKLMQLEGISDITAKFIHDSIRQTERYDNLFKFGLKIIYPKNKPASMTPKKGQKDLASYLGIVTQKQIKIYVTGSVEGSSKQELRDLIEDKGIEWGSGVSKSLDYLVLAENAGQAKQKQAESLGVKTISWKEFKENFID